MAAPSMKVVNLWSKEEENNRQQYNEAFRSMDEQIRNLRRRNENLERNYFTLNNRTCNVAEKLGFSNFEELEEAISDGNSYRIVESPSEAGFVTLDECQPAVNTSIERSCNPNVTLSNARKSDSIIKVENEGVGGGEDLALRLRILTQKYDVLHAAKEKAEAKYKKDYKKWKTFKDWLIDRVKRDELAEEKEKEKELANVSVRRSPFVDTTNALSNKGSEARALPTSKAELHESGSAPSSIDLKSPSRRLEPLSLPVSPLNKIVFNVPPPQNGIVGTICEGSKDFVQGCSKMHYEDSESSRVEAPKISLGRYTKSKNSDTINAAFAVNVTANDGIDFAFDEVVRGREKRHRLDADDCDCCRDYYDRVVPIPNALAPPLWKSPTKAPRTPTKGGGRGHQDHKKRISRHRHQWAPPSTPPDYWSIGFPNTQEVASINKRAEEMHKDKRRRIEEEVRSGTGRYVRKQDVS